MLSASQKSTLDTGILHFTDAPLGVHVSATGCANLNMLSSYRIDKTGAGVSGTHVSSTLGAQVNYGGITVTGAAGLTFSIYAAAADMGIINAGGVPASFSGFAGVVGQKYGVAANADITSAGTVYPGSIAGTTATGGIYS